jgi:1-acyl-sn-glycerol-3-phosphate acyltransferase
VFFAEGERSANGDLSAFKKGGAAFAIDAGLPVVPVAVAGSEQVLPKHSLMVMPGSIRVAFGEPIPTVGLLASDRERVTTIAHDRVRDLLQRIECAPSEA